MNKNDVVKLMESSTSEKDWDLNVDKVKQAFNGYPSFWYESIISAGILQKTAAKWGGSAKIEISTF